MDRLCLLALTASLLAAACSEHDDHGEADPHANHGSAGSAGVSAGEMWMYHCHILEHAEHGMMGEIHVH
jgi:hypothetical protein